MENWKIEPTVFMNAEEIEEAVELGFLNYDREGAITDDGCFGYKTRQAFPTMFYGGGENDRPNHQPMFNDYGHYCWSVYEVDLRNSKLWSARRKEFEFKPCPFCGSTDIKLMTTLEMDKLSSCFDEANVNMDAYSEDPHYVICDASSGHSGCGNSSGFGSTREVLLSKWNTRNGNW